MSELTFGIIGAGMIGELHGRTLGGIEGVRVKTVADLRPEAAEKVVGLAGGGGATASDWRAIVDDPAIDAVVVCTPPWLHHEMTMACLGAGKHVLCEKPFADSLDHAEEMVATAEAQGVVIADCSARHARLQPTYRTAKAIIDSGQLSDIYLIHHYGRGRRGRPGIEYHPAAKWFLDRSRAVGGTALDWGVYDLSLIWGLLGDDIDCVEAIGFTAHGIDDTDPGAPVFDVEEHGGGALKLSNGTTVLWDRAAACHMDAGSETRIYGLRGGLKFEPWNRKASHLMFYRDVVNGLPTDLEVPIRGQDQHESDHKWIDIDFVDALRTGRPPMMPGKTAVRILRAIFMMYRSAGVPV